MMSEAPEISVVVPFFNEAENVRELHERLVKALDGCGRAYELVYVDDGSTDATSKELSDVQSSATNVTLIRLRRNFGQTPALAAGFDHARGQVIIAMDGDLQHDPAEIPKFLEGIDEGFDMVSGWRKARADSFFVRRLPSAAANRLMAWLSGVKIHDFGTTFKAYRREVLEHIELFGELHRFIPALASAVGAKIKEIPISNINRERGRSKYSLSRVFGVLFDLLTVKFLISYLGRPLKVFGMLGLASFALGFAISAGLMIGWAVSPDPDYNVAKEHAGLLLLSVFFMMSGIQFVTVGLVAEIAVRTYHQSSGKPIYVIRDVLRPQAGGGDTTGT